MSRWTLIVVLVAAVMLTGCGTPAQPAAPAPPRSAEPFVLALPRIVVNVDAAGNLDLFGLSPALFGLDVRFPQPLLDTLVAADIQHLEVRTASAGLLLFVNGKPMPYIGWDDEALEQTADLAGVMLGQDLSAAKKLLPLVRRLGLDVVVRLPRKSGAAEIPLISLEEGARVAPKPTEGPATAIVKLDAKIDEQGLPLAFDLTAADLTALNLNLAPLFDQDTLARIKAANLQHLYIRSQPGGLFFYANGRPLLHLVWDSQFLANAVEVYGRVDPASPYLKLLKEVAPGLDRADIDVLLMLPTAANAPAVPLPPR
ncbi:MAG: hypothetical protein ACP5UQ_05895 [Anaerolineae bacterium]